MSIKSIPLVFFALILYNAIVFSYGPDIPAHEIFNKPIFELSMPMGGTWVFQTGDLVLLLSLCLLFVELIKATFTRGQVLVDHGLSMVVFILCLIEFLLVDRAATSVFFLITFIAAIDVVAGAIIGIRTARRDFGLGHDIT